MDEKRGIGKNNQLLFKISQDLQRFKNLTTGHPVIMGRKTYESIGRLLPNRTNIVISRKTSLERRGLARLKFVHSLDGAIELAKTSEGSEEVFIIGGGQIFAQAIEKNLVDKLYLTIVEGNYDADTFFPEYEGKFKIVNEEKGEEGGYKFRFVDLARV